MIRSSLVVLSLLLMAACKQLSPAEPTEVELEWPEPAPTQPAPTQVAPEAETDTPPVKADDSVQGVRPEPMPEPAPGP